jgi:hypothetical protein
MTTDTELENWQREWREHTEPLPELKKKIRRQNWQTVAAIVGVCACLVFSTVRAIQTHSSFMAGGAAGIAFAGIVMGSYAWWLRRGSWKPSAQTTLAYAELAYKRAVAKARLLRFIFIFLLFTVVLFSGFLALKSGRIHPREMIIAAGMIVELFYIKRQERRKLQEVEETKKLLADIKE